MDSCEKSYKKQWDFYKKLVFEITPKLKKYERERKLRHTVNIFFAVVFTLISLCVPFFTYSANKPDVSLIFSCFIIALCLLGILLEINKKSFENKVKKEIMPVFCSFYEDLRWYKGSGCKKLASIENSCLLPNYTRKKYDDIFSGSYKDVCFTIAEARYSGRLRDTESPGFHGVILKFEMNKAFVGHTVVWPHVLLAESPAKHLKRTVLEDINFEKKYDVFCNDEIEARYLITPSFMERLTNMKTVFSACEVHCAFYHRSLYIALQTSKDLFSICDLAHPVNDFSQYDQMYNEIISIFELVDYFKLNEKTGL